MIIMASYPDSQAFRDSLSSQILGSLRSQDFLSLFSWISLLSGAFRVSAVLGALKALLAFDVFKAFGGLVERSKFSRLSALG